MYRFLIVCCTIIATLLTHPGRAQDVTSAAAPKKVAAIVTVYRSHSHADTIVSRLLRTETLDGKGRKPSIELVSLYVDQFPENDISRELAKTHGFTLYDSIAGALTLGGDRLAVDGVLLIAEHGDYPKSPTGNTQYPKRRFFDETVAVFRASERVAPVYMDKHIADNWADISHIYTTARELKIPMCAGSVVPLAARVPALDTARGAKLDQMVVLSYHTLDSYGFHALELAQSLAERRAGGETGVAAVQTLSGDALWSVIDDGRCDPRLVDAAMSLQTRRTNPAKTLREQVRRGSVMILTYRDGFTLYAFTLNGVVDQWTAAWKGADGTIAATGSYLAEEDPYIHFALLTRGLESLVNTGQPPWPLARTVLVSGALDALLQSHTQDGLRFETPQLDLKYETNFDWQQPPATFPRRAPPK